MSYKHYTGKVHIKISYKHYTRYFSFRLPHLNISTGSPQTNWARIVSECGLLQISVNEMDTTTSGLRWIFHVHSEFSRPAMCNNGT